MLLAQMLVAVADLFKGLALASLAAGEDLLALPPCLGNGPLGFLSGLAQDALALLPCLGNQLLGDGLGGEDGVADLLAAKAQLLQAGVQGAVPKWWLPARSTITSPETMR